MPLAKRPSFTRSAEARYGVPAWDSSGDDVGVKLILEHGDLILEPEL